MSHIWVDPYSCHMSCEPYTKLISEGYIVNGFWFKIGQPTLTQINKMDYVRVDPYGRIPLA